MAASASPRAGGSEAAEAYEDLLPVMGERLGAAGLLSELRAGFRLLADPARGAITAESLRRGAAAAYEDLLPVMGERLGAAGLLSELRARFRLLADPARGAITAESLRRGAAAALGVTGMTPAEAAAMVREGDHDGDGALSEAEFCVLMVRLSPGIMADAEAWLEEAIADELAQEGPHQLAGAGTAAPAGSRRSV